MPSVFADLDLVYIVEVSCPVYGVKEYIRMCEFPPSMVAAGLYLSLYSFHPQMFPTKMVRRKAINGYPRFFPDSSIGTKNMVGWVNSWLKGKLLNWSDVDHYLVDNGFIVYIKLPGSDSTCLIRSTR